MKDCELKDHIIVNVSSIGYWLEDLQISHEKKNIKITVRKNDNDDFSQIEIVFMDIKKFYMDFYSDEESENYIPSVLGLFWDEKDKYIFTTDTFEAIIHTDQSLLSSESAV